MNILQVTVSKDENIHYCLLIHLTGNFIIEAYQVGQAWLLLVLPEFYQIQRY